MFIHSVVHVCKSMFFPYFDVFIPKCKWQNCGLCVVSKLKQAVNAKCFQMKIINATGVRNKIVQIEEMLPNI